LGKFLGINVGECKRLTISPPFLSQLSKNCGSLAISQPYRPPQPVIGLALPFHFVDESWFGSL
jgi:hypothetical protein